MAETKKEKARRYLTEGRVNVIRVQLSELDPVRPLVVAQVRGDGGTYWCGYDARRGEPAWRCTCEAWKLSASHPDCTHLLALKLVVHLDGRAPTGTVSRAGPRVEGE